MDIAVNVEKNKEGMMPNFNGQGPQGQGPMTGRGMGYCAMNVTKGQSNNQAVPGWGVGRGFGRGRGGRGFRNWFRATGIPGWMRFGRQNSGEQQ